jgi:hypothetical protein
MADYIKREDAIEVIGWFSDITCYVEAEEAVIVNRINSIPSADVVEAKRGKWKPICDANELGDCIQIGIYCSECGFDQTFCESPYCPYCGADMRGE